MLSGMVFVALLSELIRQPPVKQIEDVGKMYAASIRVAAGLPPEPTDEELLTRFRNELVTTPTEDYAAVERRFDERMGLAQQYPSRGLVFNMHGRKRRMPASWWRDHFDD